MKIEIDISGFFVNKPIKRVMDLDDDTEAYQKPNGDVLTVKELTNDQVEEYVTKKFVDTSDFKGRVKKMHIIRDGK